MTHGTARSAAETAAACPRRSCTAPHCRWLRPLGDGYDLPLDAFIWQLDAEAMAMLSSLGPLTAAAQSI